MTQVVDIVSFANDVTVSGALMSPGVGFNSFKAGAGASSGGANSVAILGSADFSSSIAVGLGSVALGNNSITFGRNSSAGQDGAAFGTATSAGQDAAAFGIGAGAGAVGSFAFGRSAIVNAAHVNSGAIGFGAATTAANQCMIGSAANPLDVVVQVGGSLTVGASAPTVARDLVVQTATPADTIARIANQDLGSAVLELYADDSGSSYSLRADGVASMFAIKKVNTGEDRLTIDNMGAVGIPKWATFEIQETSPVSSSGVGTLFADSGGAPRWRVSGSGQPEVLLFGHTISAVKTTDYTATQGEIVRCDPSGGGFNVTLPLIRAGHQIVVKNTTTSVNPITILPTSADIDGAASLVLSGSNAFAVLEGSAGTWHVIGYSPGEQPFQAILTPLGTVQTVDWDTGRNQVIDLVSATGDVTITLSNPEVGRNYAIKVLQGATTRNLIWPASVLWPAGVAPVITAANNSLDVIQMMYDGTNYIGTFTQDQK